MALGNFPLVEDIGILRFYFNLSARLAVALMETLTGLLNAAHVAFRFKLLNDDRHYDRCDSGVLYVQRNDFGSVISILRKVHPDFANGLGDRVPAFTKVLAAGVGLAENPVTNNPQETESFGMSRCRLLANGMLDAFQDGIHSLEGRLRVVQERFAKEGISIEAPYLNPHSNDEYEPMFRAPLSKPHNHSKLAENRTLDPTGQFLETALSLGRYLAKSALWWDGRCTWMGAEPSASTNTKKPAAAAFATLGPDVYGGVAGIALFLAELYRVAPDQLIADTALGAVKQAALTAERVPSTHHISLYTGWTGIAIALLRVGLLTRNDETQNRGHAFLDRLGKLPRDESETDFLSGKAGAIVGLLALHHMVERKGLVAQAELLAEEILAAADWKGCHCSWPSRIHPKKRNLAGLSHGAAGIGYALRELYETTLDIRWRDCANCAFAYEDTVFDPSLGNWPDFRDELNMRGTHRRNTFRNYWCHGAPGIALSRMYAARDRSEKYRKEELAIALNTTRRDVEFQILTVTGNFSLCHGLAGNADILLEASIQGINDFDKALPHAVGEFGITQFSGDNLWPSGVGKALNPSLMLGLAGVGYFYLRLHDPSTPSVLTFRV